MISEQIERLSQELEDTKTELSNAMEIIEHYRQQERDFIDKMESIVNDYRAGNV